MQRQELQEVDERAAAGSVPSQLVAHSSAGVNSEMVTLQHVGMLEVWVETEGYLCLLTVG